ncbi:MAG: thioredoxin domain-containing protein [Sandaracinaceae bacterium]
MDRRATLFTLSVALCVSFAGASCSGDEPVGRVGEHREAPSSTRSVTVIRRDGNHLVGEPSPYLAQHSHNPVDWYPFGPEALERARREHKPIFLSIGYSTCHWCHVMEEESFEDDEVAAYLNGNFIAIKVDREQRPDLDALYLRAVGEMGGSTGWPLSVFLTPELVPFFGGTYFPRHGGMGRPGFLDVLRELRRRWDAEGERVGANGRQIFARIREETTRDESMRGAPTPGMVSSAMGSLAGARDEYGGFGTRQKFPNTPLLLAELRSGDAAARAHVVSTLDAMMRGGIRDHLAGSFHRYSVDRRWHVPHFEKTLYDNAQLGALYVEAGRTFARAEFVAVGRAVLDDLIDGWQEDDGGFVVGFDADDPRGEGAYYTWTPAELTSALGEEDGARFATLFGVTAGGEGELDGRSVLHRIDDPRGRLGMDAAVLDAFLARTRPRLLEVRRRRPPPAMDDKILAGWNGLAIGALADVGRWLDEPRYVEAAERAARYVTERLWVDGAMLRGRRGGESLGEGFLDDHALVVLGLLRLHAADGDARWLIHAHAIDDAMVERFYEDRNATFMSTARDDAPSGLPLRAPNLDDGVLPSGGTAAILATLEVGALAGDRARHDLGQRALRAAAPRAVGDPFSSGYLLVAIEHTLADPREVVIAGDADDPRTRALLEVVRPMITERAVLARVGADGASDELVAAYPALRDKTASGGHPTAYVCRLGSCELPTGDPAELARQLGGVR